MSSSSSNKRILPIGFMASPSPPAEKGRIVPRKKKPFHKGWPRISWRPSGRRGCVGLILLVKSGHEDFLQG
jgi:hypothetical protein